MKLLLLIRTLICYLLCGIGIILFVPPLFLLACLPARFRYNNRLFFLLLQWFYSWICFASLNRITLKGAKNLPQEPALFIANHQSAFDIPVVGSLCRGYPHIWLVLAYYVDTPVLGFFIRRMFVPVERDQPVKAAGSLRKIIRFLQDKPRHLIIFPEGTRHEDGPVHEFYEGFALIAKLSGRPVIPVYMPNNRIIYPVNSFYIYPCPLDIIIGEPMTMHENETEAAFVKRVHEWFVKQYTQYQQYHV